MISISKFNAATTTTTTPSFPTLSHHHKFLCLSDGKLKLTNRTKFTISASKLPFTPPPAAPPGQVYQPYRPPPTSHLPAKYRNLPVTEIFEILRNRLGLWHEYSPLVGLLLRDGFTPASIEEVTGISGVEQNCIVVASQVRESLMQTKQFPQELLSYFDSNGGPELLNELRLLNAVQRADSAKYIIERHFEPRGAMEVARAIRDFPRRRGDAGWESFDPDSPGDCLAYTQFRLSKEAIVDSDRKAALEKALGYVETDKARERIKQELEKGDEARKAEEEQLTREVASLKVVRLRYGEVAEASSVTLLPVVMASEGAKGIVAAPGKCKQQGELGVVVADKGWTRWVVVPSWAPVLAAGEAVALEVSDTKGLPWPSMAASQENVLVLVDRIRKEVDDHGAFVVEKEGKLVLERGLKLKEAGVQTAVAAVVMVVRPPKDEDDMISDDEWD